MARKPLTIKDVQERIVEIERISFNNEAAHRAEDLLFLEFVEDVSKPGRNVFALRKIALEVLKACVIKYDRWCA